MSTRSTDPGAALRAAREQRAMSLADVSRATKVSLTILEAIESNQKDRLPQAFYLRSFLRAYARHVGLDPDDTVGRYFHFNQIEPVTEPQTFALAPPAFDGGGRWATGVQWLVIAIVLAGSVTGYRFARLRSASPDPVTQVPAARASDSREIGTAGASVPAPARAVAPEAGVLHLELRADGSCWLSATADGTRVVHTMMEAGEHYALDVRKEAVLRVGDPAVFTFSINGAAGRVLGPAGEAVTAQITGDNYRDFLRR